MSTHQVLTSPSGFDAFLKACCRERNVKWATNVLGRIGRVSDLRAADAIYHGVCKLYFLRKAELPSKILKVEQSDLQTSERKRGRPLDPRTVKAFEETLRHCEKLCDENEFCTIGQHHEKMASELGKDLEPYGHKFLQKKTY